MLNVRFAYSPSTQNATRRSAITKKESFLETVSVSASFSKVNTCTRGRLNIGFHGPIESLGPWKFSNIKGRKSRQLSRGGFWNDRKHSIQVKSHSDCILGRLHNDSNYIVRSKEALINFFTYLLFINLKNNSKYHNPLQHCWKRSFKKEIFLLFSL